MCSKYVDSVAGFDGRKGYGHVASDTIFYLRNEYDFQRNILIFGLSKGGSKTSNWAEGELSNNLDIVLKNAKKEI